MRTFFSYRKAETKIVHLISKLVDSVMLDVFTFERKPSTERGFPQHILERLRESETLIAFVDKEPGSWQLEEVSLFHSWMNASDEALRLDGTSVPRKLIFVCLCDSGDADNLFRSSGPLALYFGYHRISEPFNDDIERTAMRLASHITDALKLPWQSPERLPRNPHLFSYEKHITQYFADIARLYPNGVIDPEQAQVRPKFLERDQARAQEIYNKWLDGCPVTWPVVKTLAPQQDDGESDSGIEEPDNDLDELNSDAEDCPGELIKNKLREEEIGKFRPPSARVVVTALTDSGIATDGVLSFPEAGPRKCLYFGNEDRQLNVAIMVSGGIAPGVNAVIDGVVQRHWQYARKHGYEKQLNIFGLQDGFLYFRHAGPAVMLVSGPDDPRNDNWPKVILTRDHAHEGGSILGTSRVDTYLSAFDRPEGLRKVERQLDELSIDILYIIGGDGSMKAAHALYELSRSHQSRRKPLSVVAIPKTMDNDILWVWQSFGFLSAVEKAREVIEQLNTEVNSNPRLCVVQLFGSDSGFVVSHAVLASATGHCAAALIPEVRFSLVGLVNCLRKAHMRNRDNRPPRGIVVMAETAIPTDACDYIDELELSIEERQQIEKFEHMLAHDERIQGQTNDALRSAGLKIVSRGLQKLLANVDGWELLRVVTSEPRHLLRAIPPSCLDIIIGQRLGTLAVDNALAGYTDFMISQWLTEYVLVPLELVVLGRKRIPENGMFWKSVLAKTRQPADMDMRRHTRDVLRKPAL